MEGTRGVSVDDLDRAVARVVGVFTASIKGPYRGPLQGGCRARGAHRTVSLTCSDYAPILSNRWLGIYVINAQSATAINSKAKSRREPCPYYW
jgi:hypothetical protein